MTRWITAAAVGGLLAATALPAQAQQGEYFILHSATDTISIERFRRTSTQLDAELLFKVANVRYKFTADLAPDGSVTKLTNTYWQAADTVGAEPRQTAVMTFTGDSVIAEISGGGHSVTQRLGSEAGAIPILNPSISVMELVLARAKATGKSEVPGFAVAGGKTFPITVTRPTPDSAVIIMAGAEARLAVDAQGRITGGGMPAQHLTVDRVSAAEAPSLRVRPPDYSVPPGAPYDAIEVKVPTPMGHTLAGTLTLPHGASATAKVPAIVTITGSGLEDRDESLPIVEGYRPFRQVADSLARRGIATLRMDDRGYGASGGNGATATSADFADDIRAGLAWLRERPEIDGTRLGLVGHSEGGLIAPMVAATDPKLKGIVLMAGPALTGRTIINFQLKNNFTKNKELSAKQRDSLLKEIPNMVDSMATQPWSKFFLDYDPVPTARKVKVPVLILQGATDQQVTPNQATMLDQAFKAGGDKDVTMKVFPNLNHLFVYDPSGFPGGYTQLKDRAVSRQVIGTLVDWLATHLR